MRKLTRRRFLKGVLLPAALGTLPRRAVQGEEPDGGADSPPDIIDTNVHLFDWPFRKLKYAGAKALVAKLRRHRITQAWAGSYEGLLHKNLDGVNARLAEECQANGAGILLPFGTVNPALPDWEEDLRRCQEKYRMRGHSAVPVVSQLHAAKAGGRPPVAAGPGARLDCSTGRPHGRPAGASAGDPHARRRCHRVARAAGGAAEASRCSCSMRSTARSRCGDRSAGG